MNIQDLKDGYIIEDGDHFTASIRGTTIGGKVRIIDSVRQSGRAQRDINSHVVYTYIFLCHNNKDFNGACPLDEDRLGYEFSWAIPITGVTVHTELEMVTDLCILGGTFKDDHLIDKNITYI